MKLRRRLKKGNIILFLLLTSLILIYQNRSNLFYKSVVIYTHDFVSIPTLLWTENPLIVESKTKDLSKIGWYKTGNGFIFKDKMYYIWVESTVHNSSDDEVNFEMASYCQLVGENYKYSPYESFSIPPRSYSILRQKVVLGLDDPFRAKNHKFRLQENGSNKPIGMDITDLDKPAYKIYSEEHFCFYKVDTTRCFILNKTCKNQEMHFDCSMYRDTFSYGEKIDAIIAITSKLPIYEGINASNNMLSKSIDFIYPGQHIHLEKLEGNWWQVSWSVLDQRKQGYVSLERNDFVVID